MFLFLFLTLTACVSNALMCFKSPEPVPPPWEALTTVVLPCELLIVMCGECKSHYKPISISISISIHTQAHTHRHTHAHTCTHTHTHTHTHTREHTTFNCVHVQTVHTHRRNVKKVVPYYQSYGNWLQYLLQPMKSCVGILYNTKDVIFLYMYTQFTYLHTCIFCCSYNEHDKLVYTP